ncbi:MAG: DUF721 domain-containing protein [Alphaproteobacteria bacterium]|nr:DUF721 domain-containing protein [Alphaproteobacteria bacterium]
MDWFVSESEQPTKGERARRVRALGDIMPGVGRAAFRRFGFVQSAIVARWPEIVGDAYARHSAPDALKFPAGKRSGGTLHIVCAGPFATTLQHVEPQIIERVNRFFGYAAVARIALKHGELPKRPALNPANDPAAPLPPEMRNELKDIADPDLRASLEALARQIPITKGLPKIS